MPAKPSTWAHASFSRQALADGAIVFGNLTGDTTTGGTNQASHEGKTLRRSIGQVVLAAESTNSPAFGWHGIIKVREPAQDISSIPDVATQAGYDWIFRAYWSTRTSDLNDGSQDTRVGFDLKAMRRMLHGDDILYVIKVDAGSSGTGIRWSAGWRLLFR